MMSKNLSGLCTVKSKGWVMLNGTKVESYARKGLELDPKNAACQYQIAARWVYAPAPFNNTRKGIQMMREILFGKYNLQKDDRFNVLISIAFGYDRSKNHDEAFSWAEKALEIYPENEDARNLTQGKSRVEFTD
jgi:tetratricopeptide (TPR) repeat protein